MCTHILLFLPTELFKRIVAHKETKLASLINQQGRRWTGFPGLQVQATKNHLMSTLVPIYYFASSKTFDFKNMKPCQSSWLNCTLLFRPPVEEMSDTPITHRSIESLQKSWIVWGGASQPLDKICTQADLSASVATINLPRRPGEDLLLIWTARVVPSLRKNEAKTCLGGKAALSWEVWACWRQDTCEEGGGGGWGGGQRRCWSCGGVRSEERGCVPDVSEGDAGGAEEVDVGVQGRTFSHIPCMLGSLWRANGPKEEIGQTSTLAGPKVSVRRSSRPAGRLAELTAEEFAGRERGGALCQLCPTALPVPLRTY